MKNGYLIVMLGKDKKLFFVLIYWIMVEIFLLNEENLRDVNYINGIKLDNRFCNLEWCLYFNSMKYVFQMGLVSVKKWYKKVL